MFRYLEETFKDINIFSIDHPRSVSEEHIPERFKGKFVADFFDLLDRLITETNERRFVVTGSVLVIGEIMTSLDIDPKQFSMADIFKNK